MTTLKELLVDALEGIEGRKAWGGETFISTGYRELDKFGGLSRPGELTLIAAPMEISKLEFALNCTMSGLKVIEDLNLSIFAPNLCSRLIINKLISAEGRIHREKIDTGDLDEDEKDRIVNVGRFLYSLGDRVTLSNKRNIQDIESEIESFAASSKKDRALVLVSEVNAIEGGDVLGHLKALALKLNIPIVALKTLPIECTKRPDKRSKITDLNDADRMHADKVIFVYDDGYYNCESQWKGRAEIIVAKNIAGSVGLFFLAHQPDYCSFFNLLDEDSTDH